MNRELRAFEFEVRAEENQEHGHFLEGVPIVFNSETDLVWHREIIDRDALTKTDMRDIKFLIGHDSGMVPLARSRNNNANSTMQLSVEDDGMHIRVDLDTENNADSKKLYSAAKRGDISGMSFSFTVDEDAWEDLASDKPLRHIRSIGRIFEVSAVAFPAYEGTSLNARAEDAALDSARASLESARQKADEERTKKEKDTKLADLRAKLEAFRKEAI